MYLLITLLNSEQSPIGRQSGAFIWFVGGQERELKLRRELDKLKAQRDLLRQHRRKRQFPVIAVVGYTNAGYERLILC